MAVTDKAEWVLLDTDLTTRLAILPVEKSHLYMELSEPGSGELSIPMDSTAAGLVTSGMFCECTYRGTSRGGFFVDNITQRQADISEGGGRWLSLSGRGALALLEDAIIWDDGTTSSVREFTNKTKAYILKTLIDEAQTRGGLAVLTYDFDATNDSASVAWDDSESYRLNVGTSLFDLVRQFAKSGIDFDIVLTAGSFVLSAYKNGKGTDKSETIYARVGSNCEEVKSDERGDKIKNVLRVSYKNGFLTVSDSGSITLLRRRERLLDLKQAQTSTSATTYASAIIANSKIPQKSIKVRVFDGVSPTLFEDYGMGDYIMLDLNGTETKYRVLGIQADFDGINYSSVVLELNSLLYENELNMGNDLDWLMSQWAAAADGNLTEISYWAAIGHPDDDITEIRCLHFIGTKLYIGGIFSRIGGINFTASQIAVYDISTGEWSKLDDAPTLIYVYAIASIGTDIFVGGFNGVEKYDTVAETWSQLGTGLTASAIGTYPIVNAMAVIGTDLYVTGYFDGADGTPVSDLAVWDTVGSAWADVGGGITAGGSSTAGNGKCLTAIGSILYIGGDIDEVGGALAVANVCSWNTGTSTFDDLDGGLDNTVFALAVYGSNILAGGLFTDKISEWDGAVWTTFGGGVNNTVRGITVYLTDVYAAGLFTDVGNRVARYSGGGWTELADGLNNSAYAITNYEDDIYVGGTFTEADNKPILKLGVYFSNFQSLMDYLANTNNGFDMGKAIHNATASAITDNDEIPFWEDVSNALRKITWANMKSTIGLPMTATRLALSSATGLLTTHASFYYDNTNGIIYLGGSGGMPDGVPVNYAVLNLIAPADDVPISQTLWSFGATSTSSPVIAGYRSRGTKATPTTLSSGDRLLNLAGYGHDGTGYVGSLARILFKTTQDLTATHHGAGIFFEGTPRDSTTRREFASIDEVGLKVGLLGTPGDVIIGSDHPTVPWKIHSYSATFEAVRDDILQIGMNWFSQDDATKAGTGIQIENDYVSSGVHASEYMFLWVSPNGLVARRPWQANVLYDGTMTHYMRGLINFYDNNPLSSPSISFNASVITLANGTYFTQGNNQQWLKQTNSTGSAVSLIYLTGGNVITLGTTAEAVATLGTFTAASNISSTNGSVAAKTNYIIDGSVTLHVKGTANVAVGAGAWAAATPGNYSVVVGQAAATAGTGAYNAIGGAQAATGILAGHSNAIWGTWAGYALRGGSGHVLVGREAGQALVAANYGIHIGYQAGYYETGSSKLYIDSGGSRTSEAVARQTSFLYGDMAVGGQLQNNVGTTTNNAIKEVFRIQSFVSTAATGSANGFGAGYSIYAETATDGTYQQQALVAGSWIDATNATRKAKLSLSAYDTAARLGIEIEASGTAAKLGFWGGAPVVQQQLAAYTSDGEGSAYAGIDNAQAGTPYAQLTDLNQLRAAYEILRASYDDMRSKIVTSTFVTSA